MKQMIQDAVGSIVRALVAGVVPLLVAWGVTEADAKNFAAALAGMVSAAAWGVWQKYTSRKKFLTAMASGPVTEVAVKAIVAAGMAPPVSTPTDVVPTLPGP